MQLVEILGNYMHIWQIVDIPGNGGLLNAVQELDFLPGFNFEGFPNRDSTHYATAYNIQSAHTVLRGTLRYRVRVT